MNVVQRRALQRCEVITALEHVGLGAAGIAGEHVPCTLVIGHRRLDRARVDRVTAHAVGCEFERDVLHEPDHGMLGRHVVGVVESRLDPVGRRGEHDRPRLALDHVRGDRLGRLPDAGQVDPDHLVPLLVGEFPERGLSPDAGVGDQDVDPAELGDPSRDGGIEVPLVADVIVRDARSPQLLAVCVGDEHLMGVLGPVHSRTHRGFSHDAAPFDRFDGSPTGSYRCGCSLTGPQPGYVLLPLAAAPPPGGAALMRAISVASARGSLPAAVGCATQSHDRVTTERMSNERDPGHGPHR